MLNFFTEHPLTTNKDISSRAFWQQEFDARDDTFQWLRKNAPVSWHEPLETVGLGPEVHGEKGFWALTLAEDITYASQHHELFSSARGHISFKPLPPSQHDGPATFLNMDPPLHAKYRRIMSAAFTPKAVAKLSDQINQRAEKIVDRVVGAGQFDFVEQVSAKLPMLTVADLVGIPESQVEAFAKAGDNSISVGDAAVRPVGMSPMEFQMEQIGILLQIGAEIVEYRRKHPADDIATALATAEFDGQKLTQQDIGMVMLLLSTAGNDTTKQTTTRTVYSLDRNPDQRSWLNEDFDSRIAGSIEEFVRHASPVLEFSRTATTEIALRGQIIAEGDKVVLFYCSGNRDENIFLEPARFNLARPRNPHVGFGGGGVHYCLGNGVAKAQLRALFSQIETKLPHMEVGEPEYLDSEFINGIRRLPVVA